jgi:hypothetical protein
MADLKWLRDALEASVPEPPPSDRVGAIRERRRRARRRRNILVGVSAAVAIAVVAVTPVALRAGGSSDDGLASETRDPTYDGPACPPADAKPSGPSTIPRHPVSVRLCPGNGMPIDPPRDALVTGADQVAAVVNDLGNLPAYPACTDELGPGYRLLFAYPDGSTASAEGELYGCRSVTVGTIVRQGAHKPLDAFVDLLQEQRAASSVPDLALPTPTCGDEQQGFEPRSLVADGAPMVQGVFCRPIGGRVVEVPVDDADVATIAADHARQEPHLTLEGCVGDAAWSIVGRTAWGDRTQIRGACDSYEGDTGSFTIGAPARQILDALLAKATSR